jgi:hypothetical protein
MTPVGDVKSRSHYLTALSKTKDAIVQGYLGDNRQSKLSDDPSDSVTKQDALNCVENSKFMSCSQFFDVHPFIPIHL